MSFRGNLLRAGIDSDGKIVTVYRNDGRLDVSTANSDTTGTIRSAIFTHTEGAESLTKITEVMKVILNSEYTTGNWVNAILGRIDYGSAGDAQGGMAAAICAEVNLPGKSCGSGAGAMYPLDLEIEAPTSYVSDANPATPVAFMRFGLWGSAATEVDSGGYLFHTDGLTAGSGGILSANSRTLKVNIEGTAKYIYLSDTEDDLGAMVVDSITIPGGTGASSALEVGSTSTGVQVDGTPAYAANIYADVVTGSYTNIGAFNCRTTIAADAVVTSSSFTNAAYCRLEMEGAATVSGWNCAIMGYTKQVTGACVAVGSRVVAAIVGGINLSAGYVDIAGETACFIAYSYSNVSATVTPYYPAFYVMDSGLKDFTHGFRVGTNAATNGVLVGTVTGVGITLEGAATGIAITGACTTAAINIAGGTSAGHAILVGTSETGFQVDGTPDYAVEFYADVITGSYTNIGVQNNRLTIADDATVTSNSFTTCSYNRIEIAGAAWLSGWVCPVFGYLKTATSDTVNGSASVNAAVVGLVNLNTGFTDTGNSCTAAFIAGTYGNHGTVTEGLSGYLVMDQAQDNFENGFFCNDNAATTGMRIGICTTGVLLSGAMTTGISITGAMTTGISIVTALASAAGKGITLTPSCAAAMTLSDGHAFGLHMSATSSGANTGNTGALASWLNLTGTAPAGSYNSAINTGIWVPDSGATMTNSNLIFGMRMQAIVGESDFARLCPFSMNSTQNISALFQIGSPDLSAGIVLGTSGMATTKGSMAMVIDSNGIVGYVKLYEEPAS